MRKSLKKTFNFAGLLEGQVLPLAASQCCSALQRAVGKVAQEEEGEELDPLALEVMKTRILRTSGRNNNRATFCIDPFVWIEVGCRDLLVGVVVQFQLYEARGETLIGCNRRNVNHQSCGNHIHYTIMIKQ